MLFYIGDTIKLIDLEDLYDEFGGNESFEKNMSFTINLPDNCILKGEYKGDSFREIIASGGPESLCNKFSFKKGDNPDEFTDQIVKRDIADQINRKLKEACVKIDKQDLCNKKDYCEWDSDECIFKNN